MCTAKNCTASRVMVFLFKMWKIIFSSFEIETCTDIQKLYVCIHFKKIIYLLFLHGISWHSNLYICFFLFLNWTKEPSGNSFSFFEHTNNTREMKQFAMANAMTETQSRKCNTHTKFYINYKMKTNCCFVILSTLSLQAYSNI